jgi:hypothetical protein
VRAIGSPPAGSEESYRSSRPRQTATATNNEVSRHSCRTPRPLPPSASALGPRRGLGTNHSPLARIPPLLTAPIPQPCPASGDHRHEFLGLLLCAVQLHLLGRMIFPVNASECTRTNFSTAGDILHPSPVRGTGATEDHRHVQRVAVQRVAHSHCQQRDIDRPGLGGGRQTEINYAASNGLDRSRAV